MTLHRRRGLLCGPIRQLVVRLGGDGACDRVQCARAFVLGADASLEAAPARPAAQRPRTPQLPSDLPYLLAGGAPDFNMLICHWAALGYLTIEMDEKGHVLLHRQVIMGNERKRLEVQDFRSRCSARGDVCDGASLPL